MELPQKDIRRLKRAQAARAMRLAMGVKSGEVAAKIGVLQSNYSKMEHGLEILNNERFSVIKKMFIQWRVKEIVRLQDQIEYLLSLTKDEGL
jgi:predicted transcriptional regulator